MWVMRDSNVANAAKESAPTEFPHGLQDFCTEGGRETPLNGAFVGDGYHADCLKRGRLSNMSLALFALTS
jgi:hypothetical protein